MTEHRGSAPFGSHAYHYKSAASTNATVITDRPSTLTQIIAINVNSTVYYLKFYNQAATPVVGTDTVYFMLPIPGATGAAGVVIPFPHGVRFDSGLTFALTGAIADVDTTVAATGVVIDIFWE